MMPTPMNHMFYRWCDAMRQRVPQMPPEVFETCYAGLEAGRGFTRDEIAAGLRCDEDQAAHWYHEALVWLLDPALYAPLFAAEDQLADLRTQRTSYVLNMKATADRLAALDEAIATTKTYGLLSPAHEAEVAPKIAALDEERVTLLRHQERDLPAMRQLLEADERAVQDRLQRAQEAINEAFEAQVDHVQQDWLETILERCEPILEVLRRAHTIDEAAKALGRHAHLSGSLALRQAVVSRVQGQR
jgi:hypothetical protein